MSGLRQRMEEELQLRRYSVRTQESYVSWVAQLAKHYGKSPEQISSEELRAYFVHLTVERKLSRSSVTTALSAVKFLYEAVLKQEWQEFGLARPRAEKKLPVVLSVEEVQRVLNGVRQERYKVCLSVIYSCGLRRELSRTLALAGRDASASGGHRQCANAGACTEWEREQGALRAATATHPGTVAAVLGYPS